MNLSLVILKCGTRLVSQTEELDYEPKVHLNEPYELTGKTKVVLTPWPGYTDDTHILLRSDDLLTVVSPTETIGDAYLKKVGKTMEDLQTKTNRVQLNEQELIPDPPQEEYDPYYLEE